MSTRKGLAMAVALAASQLLAQETNSPSIKPDWLHISAGTEIWSSYHLYGAVFNDEPSWTYQGSLDFDLPWSLGSIGGGFWTLSDMTDRCKEYNSWWNKETDLDIHWFGGYSINDDWRVNCGLLYIWFNYYHTHGGNMETQRSLIFTVDMENPYVTPFVSVEYQHAYDAGVMLQYGVRRTFEPVNDCPWSITPAVYMTSGSGNFMGGLFPAKVDGGDYGFCIGSIFAELRTDYAVCDWLGIFAKATWMSTLNGDIRDAIDAAGGTYHKDWLCFEIGANFTF